MARRNGITVEEALKMEVMSSSKVIAGFKGVKNIISNVNVMADPDIMSWVEGGEFLLTTGYSLNKVSEEEQRKLISESKDIGLAGLGVKIRPYLNALPSEVIALADEIDFPIIEIDENVSISEIMTPIVKEIFDRQSVLLKKIENIYEQFMEAMLNSMDIKGLIKLTSENVKNPVLVKLDFPNKVIGELNGIDDETAEMINESIENFYDHFHIKEERRIHESKETINGKNVDRLVLPIVAKESVYGHIFIWGIGAPLGGYEISVAEIASTTIALEVLKALSVREVENKYKSEFIEDLISLDKKRNEKSVERLTFFNLKHDSNYLCMTIKLKNVEKTDDINENVTSMQQYISRIHDKLERIAKREGISAVVGSKMEQIIVLVSFPDREKLKQIEKMLPKIEDIVYGFNDIEARIGVGRVYKGIESFNLSYVDSLRAINTGKILDDGRTTIFENLGIYKLLCQDHLEEELSRFYDKTIKTLVDYDQRKSTELVRTLEAYFENNGNLKKMSDMLFTHYNTILYRVQRIKEITDMDLENPSDRLNLEVAIKIKKILGK